MFIKANDVLALLPFLFVTAISMVVVMVDAFHRTDRPRNYIANLSWVGLLLAIGTVVFTALRVPAGLYFSEMIYHDGVTSFFNVIFLVCGVITLMIAPPYLRERGAERGEFYSLVLMSVTGMMLMASAADLVMGFIGLEVMSVAIYVLAGFFRRDARSAEGSAKYFFLGAFASGIFLYGMALVYGTTGSTGLEGIARALQQSAAGADNALVLTSAEPLAALGLDPLFFIGMLLLLVGMAFKIALVPFHMWTPDAYEGAPSVSAGFMASAVKAAGFAALMRVLFIALGPEATRFGSGGWTHILFYLALISIVLGNLLAIVQQNVKRMLAYSSIAHAGYAVIGLVAAGYIGAGQEELVAGYLEGSSVLFYLAVYAVATLGAFGVLAYLSSREREIETYEDLGGVAQRYPFVALMMSIFMLSSAGIPPTAGFVAKFYVFRSAIVAAGETGDQAFVWLVVAAVLASVAGAWYYLRVIVQMYMRPQRGTLTSRSQPLGFAALAFCGFVTVWVGLFPTKTASMPGLVELSRASIESFRGTEVNYGLRSRGPRGVNVGAAAPDAPAGATVAPVFPPGDDLHLDHDH